MRYRPHDYQDFATTFIEEHPVSAVFLDCGLGKTVITLTALHSLMMDSFEIHKALVIAPLRVARDTWKDEASKWDHLSDLRISVAVGAEDERLVALRKEADIYVINRENVQWLIEESTLSFDYDALVIDELSNFKNHQAKRFKALMKVRRYIRRVIGLTGTPSSNSLMDLWAEFRLLDMGERLGRYIGQYRSTYFTPDRRNAQVVFSYKPLPGSEDAIYNRIGDITIHNRKLDALEDIVEAANGKPLLVAYWFRHDLERITTRLKAMKISFQCLDSASSIAKWNRGELPVALIHPASAGHGLNLQAGGNHLVWFGLTWSFELYQQTNARLWRQGQASSTVVIQHIVTEGTIDERILKALEGKKKTQDALLDAVKAEIGGGYEKK